MAIILTAQSMEKGSLSNLMAAGTVSIPVLCSTMSLRLYTRASISRTYQYLHLVSNNGTTLPTDVWVPSTYSVKPQVAWQYSAGYFRNFLNDRLETSVEVYYKEMENQVQYKDGYVPNSIEDPELSYVFGKGRAYGVEFFINKTQENSQAG